MTDLRSGAGAWWLRRIILSLPTSQVRVHIPAGQDVGTNEWFRNYDIRYLGA